MVCSLVSSSVCFNIRSRSLAMSILTGCIFIIWTVLCFYLQCMRASQYDNGSVGSTRICQKYSNSRVLLCEQFHIQEPSAVFAFDSNRINLLIKRATFITISP